MIKKYNNELQLCYLTPGPRSFQLAFYEKYIAGNPIYGDQFDDYGRIIMSNLTSAETFDQLDRLNLIERNFLRVNILFDHRGLETLNNTAAMTWDSLASNIGGSLSLWIGITVMTLFELVELVYRLTKLLAVRRSSSTVDDQEIVRSSSKNTKLMLSKSAVTPTGDDEK